MSNDSRAFTSFTKEISRELVEKNASKISVTMGELRLYECPLSYITEETWQVMRLVFLTDGSQQLYFPGGWGNQPHWLIEALELYRAENARRSGADDGKTDRDGNISG